MSIGLNGRNFSSKEYTLKHWKNLLTFPGKYELMSGMMYRVCMKLNRAQLPLVDLDLQKAQSHVVVKMSNVIPAIMYPRMTAMS